MCKSNFQIIRDVNASNILSERDILNVIHRVNRSYYSCGKSCECCWDAVEAAQGCNLTPEHTEKGLAWLHNYIWKKSGDVRKTCEMSLHNIHIVDEFRRFYFAGIQNISRYGAYYVPVWGVVANNGDTFEYYVNGGRLCTC